MITRLLERVFGPCNFFDIHGPWRALGRNEAARHHGTAFFRDTTSAAGLPAMMAPTRSVAARSGPSCVAPMHGGVFEPEPARRE